MTNTKRRDDDGAALAWADRALECARGREKLEALIRAVRTEILFETGPHRGPRNTPSLPDR